jgi:alpha-beta hydrolase superfamily lysophospholipase
MKKTVVITASVVVLIVVAAVATLGVLTANAGQHSGLHRCAKLSPAVARGVADPGYGETLATFARWPTMKRRLVSAGVAATIAGSAAAALLLWNAHGARSVSDPASARCNAPPVAFGSSVDFADHRQVDVHFTCMDARLAGTLYLRKRPGPFPAVVYVHGSSEASRWGWDVPWVSMTVRAGIAFFSYDKRGVGESEGTCCPGDHGHYNLLAADADGAVNAVRERSEIDPARIGFLGISQSGWIVPLAVVRSRRPVAFTALASAPAVTTHEEQQWSKAASEEADSPPPLTVEKRKDITRNLSPSGFDPVPLLQQMTAPGIWVYGRQDRSIPAEKSAATLERLRKTEGKDFTVVLFPQAAHGLLDTPPTDPRAMLTLLAWIQKHVRPT